MFLLINEFDIYILQFIQNNMHTPVLDKLMIFATKLGNNGLIWIFISILLVIISKKHKKAGFVTLLALFIGAMLGEVIIKHIVQRPRPFLEMNTIKLLIPKPKSFSFPSGHTTAAFAAVVVLSRYFKKYSIEFFILAFLIAFSRMYLCVHYPTDVLAGIILGIISGKIALGIASKFY